VTVVDDSYNSSPSALARSLDVVAREKSATRKVAVLGEMLELGGHAERLHAESGRLVAQSGVDVLYVIGGPAARALAAAAIDAGMSGAAVTYFPSSDEAAPAIAAAVCAGDLVLVKGSRGIRTDVVVDRLAGERA
jgi:UDP-N-acetylmuramoyl-tripeptide--D-alanyl-D-alanine ligase